MPKTFSMVVFYQQHINPRFVKYLRLIISRFFRITTQPSSSFHVFNKYQHWPLPTFHGFVNSHEAFQHFHTLPNIVGLQVLSPSFKYSKNNIWKANGQMCCQIRKPSNDYAMVYECFMTKPKTCWQSLYKVNYFPFIPKHITRLSDD